MPNYNSNPNQRGIKTHKEKCDKQNLYTLLNLEALQKAMSALTPKAFELWIYLAKNQDQHFFWLSKVDFLYWSNIKGSSYYNAFNELVENGYLLKKEDQENQYDFYELPMETPDKIGITTHKQ